MKIKLQGAIVLFSLAVFASCQKQPAANFTTDKSDYIAGETVHLTNSSADASTYFWTMPDGQTSDAVNVNYTIDQTAQDGVLTFKLFAYSKNGKKSDDVSKSVNVAAAKGQLMVWTSNSSAAGPISVFIDNVAMGTVTMYYTGAPTCGANGCVTSTLKVGSHTISASDGTGTWTGSINVNANTCSSFQLQ